MNSRNLILIQTLSFKRPLERLFEAKQFKLPILPFFHSYTEHKYIDSFQYNRIIATQGS